jgi:hypothetical protein
MSKVTKKQRVIEALRGKGTIQPYYAFNYLGETRLAATINQLKKEGWRINTTKENGVNKFGDKITYAKYHLVSEPK